MTGRFWLVQVRPLFEQRFARDLDSAGVDYFLPMTRIRRTRIDRGRQRQITQTRPLFPPYLFVNLAPDDRPDAVVRSIASPKLIKIVNQLQIKHELTQLECALDIDDTLTACPIIREGEGVRVVDGPFIGLQGHAVHQDGQCRVQFRASLLGQCVEVTVPLDRIEPC